MYHVYKFTSKLKREFLSSNRALMQPHPLFIVLLDFNKKIIQKLRIDPKN